MENPMKIFFRKSLGPIFFLFSVLCSLSSVLCPLFSGSALAAGVEVSVTGTKVGAGSITSWDIGLIKAAQTVYSCGTAPDVNCADTGDVYWTITGSSDGSENISATVVSSGNWTAEASSGVNAFVLKAKNDDALILDETTSKTLYTSLPAGANFKLGLAFTSPASDSSQGQQTMTITLTASTWAWACGNNLANVNHTAGAVAPVTTTITYGTVTSSLSGASKCWIKQNLGAANQASSATDATDASAGWYWQFNRKQGYAVGPTPSWTITSINESSDWTSVNDPCTILLGAGWRLPTSAEWTNADATGQVGGWDDYNETFTDVLKLHAAGYLYVSGGVLYNRGSGGFYWSSTQYSATAGWYLYFSSGGSYMVSTNKAYGFSIRCLRD
ncbi:MAG: hypothetical protein HZB36_01570 [Candidatus Omnitrophica bacterium]|nr:hypothetical protein [Candidatus Omnitrophota bacterium]